MIDRDFIFRLLSTEHIHYHEDDTFVVDLGMTIPARQLDTLAGFKGVIEQLIAHPECELAHIRELVGHMRGLDVS